MYVYLMVQNNRRLYSKLANQALDKLKARLAERESQMDSDLAASISSMPALKPYSETGLLQVPKVNPNFQQVKEHKQLQARISYFERLIEEQDTSILPAEMLDEVQVDSYVSLMKQYLKNPEFNSHPLLSLSFNLYSLMNVFG